MLTVFRAPTLVLLEPLQSANLAGLPGLAGWQGRVLTVVLEQTLALLESLQSSNPAGLAELAGWQGRLAGQDAKGVNKPSVGPTRKLAILQILLGVKG